MDPISIAGLLILCLFISILLGIHIAFALAGLSVLGIYLITGNFTIATSILASTAFESMRTYTFAVVPLFMLMGTFMSNSSTASDLFKFTNHVLRKIPGGLGVATVAANAIFAAITGISIAAAAVFSKVSTPLMLKHNYSIAFATGSVAGSSTLGMLIPPSITLIIYGMLSEVSIGRLFIAGIIPGIILGAMFSIVVVFLAIYKPGFVYNIQKNSDKNRDASEDKEEEKINMKKLSLKVLPIFFIIFMVLGGIWGGVFTPTEASGFGALGALVVGVAVGGLRWKGFKKSLLETASSTASVLLLIMSAMMYSRMLALSGVIPWLSDLVLEADLGSYAILFIFLGIVILMGCILDSTSILLLIVPLAVPIMIVLGFDLIWFGIVLILTVHMGLLTPPFGMCVFAVKSSIDIEVPVQTIFWGAMPFFAMMIPHLLLIIFFPILATWLPSLM